MTINDTVKKRIYSIANSLQLQAEYFYTLSFGFNYKSMVEFAYIFKVCNKRPPVWENIFLAMVG
jgi:hypothetical protein